MSILCYRLIPVPRIGFSELLNQLKHQEHEAGQHKQRIEVRKLLYICTGAGSRNVNKLLLKQRFCSIFDRSYHNDFQYYVVGCQVNVDQRVRFSKSFLKFPQADFR